MRIIDITCGLSVSINTLHKHSFSASSLLLHVRTFLSKSPPLLILWKWFYRLYSTFIPAHKTDLWMCVGILKFSLRMLIRIGNVGIIANFVLSCICSFLLYLHQLILINWKLEIKEHMRIIFQGCMFYWTCWFLIAKLKQSWQCCHSCIREHLWKTLLMWLVRQRNRPFYITLCSKYLPCTKCKHFSSLCTI